MICALFCVYVILTERERVTLPQMEWDVCLDLVLFICELG